jgi:lincosamide nucleotidyltransferase A/C/D/E
VEGITLPPEPHMTSASLIALFDFLEEAAIESWLDGGWGVDALLRAQTRPHKDVDLVLRVADVPRLLTILGSRGFLIREGSPPNSFVLADGSGLEVDVHAVVFDAQGNGVYRMQNGQDWIYPAAGFAGQGAVGERQVHCLSPEVQVLCHAEGYTPTDKDVQDMQFLEERFGLELPLHLKSEPP